MKAPENGRRMLDSRGRLSPHKPLLIDSRGCPLNLCLADSRGGCRYVGRDIAT